MYWEAVTLPEGLTVSPDGELSGRTTPGHHELTVRAYFPPQLEFRNTWQLTLDVSDPCLVTFVSEAESPGVPRVAAVRVDTTALEGWMPEDPGVAVVDYDLSADGRYLAATVDGGGTLELFSLDQPGVPNAEYEHAGTHLAHAFSPDSRWLAVATTDPDADETQLLELVRIDGETWTSAYRESIRYTDGLAWFGDNEILVVGPDEARLDTLIPISWSVGDEELRDRVEYWAFRIDVYDYLARLLTSPKGFFVQSYVLSAYLDDVSKLPTSFFEPIQAISPGMTYRALIDADTLLVNPLTQIDEEEPYASGEGCEAVRAWSEDENTLLCSSGYRYNVFDLEGEGDLTRAELDVSATVWSSARAALSGQGDWVAFLPTEDGLYVVPRSQFTEQLPETPFLETRLGGWDFFFAANEQRLFVQQGERLLVVPLGAAGPGEPLQLSENMGTAPECERGWGNSASWCGVARLDGNVVLSTSERFLAFHDVNHRIDLVDLDSMHTVNIGTQSSSCETHCIQFQ